MPQKRKLLILSVRKSSQAIYTFIYALLKPKLRPQSVLKMSRLCFLLEMSAWIIEWCSGWSEYFPLYFIFLLPHFQHACIHSAVPLKWMLKMFSKFLCPFTPLLSVCFIHSERSAAEDTRGSVQFCVHNVLVFVSQQEIYFCSRFCRFYMSL